MELLKEILSWVRPAGSKSEAAFVEWLKTHIKSLGYEVEVDGYGNLFVRIGQSSTLFTCHTDTVHSRNLNVQRQEVVYSETSGQLMLAEPSPGFVLGADDGTGIWILLQLMQVKVPATYVFYREEEVGGLGSEWSVRNEAWRYDGIKRAVAFDRRGQDSVITHQSWARCCSDSFAKALSEALGSGFAPDNET